MEFWGVEVKPGKPTKIEHEYGRLIHISHASLGEVSKDAGSSISISLRVKINGKDLFIGTLSPEDWPQSKFDLIFEKSFELSHDWKDGSVYFLGYSVEDPDLDVGEVAPEEDEPVKEIGLLELDDGAAAAASLDEEDSGDDDDGDDKALDEEDSDDEEDGDDKALDESLAGDSNDDLSEQDSEDDGDDDPEEEEEEEEELPKASKKRTASPSASVFAKKAKSGAQKKRT